MAREWWIHLGFTGQHTGTKYPHTILDVSPDNPSFIHVVEYSEITKWKDCAKKLSLQMKKHMSFYKQKCPKCTEALAEYEKLRDRE